MEISEHLNIPDVEKENLNFLAEIIYGLTAGSSDLEVVGGAVNKRWPRKDIDVTITMLRGRGDSELSRCEDRLSKLEYLIDQVDDASEGYFSKYASIAPHIDPGFESNDILAHEGTVIIKPLKGTLIELVPIS